MGYCYVCICFASCVIAYLWCSQFKVRNMYTDIMRLYSGSYASTCLPLFLSLTKSPLHLYLIQIPRVHSERDE